MEKTSIDQDTQEVSKPDKRFGKFQKCLIYTNLNSTTALFLSLMQVLLGTLLILKKGLAPLPSDI